MSTPSSSPSTQTEFSAGIRYYADTPWSDWDRMMAQPAVSPSGSDPASAEFAYQTTVAADALRYLTLQVCASKGSGHPGGFCSSAEAHAALMMLGWKDIFTEVGHHAPGFYSALFLDKSLEQMDIHSVDDFMARFRETHGLLGHLSGAIPGVLNPAGPLGQGQHFSLAAALLNPDRIFPVTIGDGGMGEPYVMSAFKHFNTSFPATTNCLPILLWNGFSQEHHSMVSTDTNEEMVRYWEAHGFKNVILVDAKDFDDADQAGDFVDSTRFSLARRLAFTRSVIDALLDARTSALETRQATVFIIKQLKGAGTHDSGSKAHHLYPQFTLEHPQIIDGLKRRALPKDAWDIVRANFSQAGGGPAAEIVITEKTRPLADIPELNIEELPQDGSTHVSTTQMGKLIVELGNADPDFFMTSADGNEASGVRNASDGLLIRHPVADERYSQGPNGRVYEPISEDACAGLASALALMGGRSLWMSYESFAINGLPVFQTVTQAMAEARRVTPPVVACFTAGAIEQGRNGWTHQRPEVEAYFMALARNGNVYPLFPYDANCAQAAFSWANQVRNSGVAIFASKSAMPIRASVAEAEQAIHQGAIVLHETQTDSGAAAAEPIVLAGVGDMIFKAIFEAKDLLEQEGHAVRIVAVVNPRAVYRPSDTAMSSCSICDNNFMNQNTFQAIFHGSALVGISGGAANLLEPMMERSQVARRRLLSWKRGETTASPQGLFEVNGLDGATIAKEAKALRSSFA